MIKSTNVLKTLGICLVWRNNFYQLYWTVFVNSLVHVEKTFLCHFRTWLAWLCLVFDVFVLKLVVGSAHLHGSLIVSCLWCCCLEISCWLSSLTWHL